ncbi:MAG: MFS transporter [Bifidobacteriaceae bacterium]|jgi:MFS family permease|nr:MFS transporter [Bifidobacteriaceae bacterium]MCI1914946.1 MFS transporter [Bifidobacteriaceae bacterium]
MASSPTTTPTSTPATPSSPWSPLRHKAFRWLWLAQLGSNTGVWMQTVGAQWFLVEQSHSSAIVAWVQTASTLPALLLSLVAGVLADSYDRKALLIISNGAATFFAALLALLSYANALSPWSLLALTFLLGCSSTLTGPAWQAIQPELVPRSELASASALGSVTVNAARAIGPAIAGFLVSMSGPSLVFALNAASFAIVIVALVGWKHQRTQVSHRDSLLSSLKVGISYSTHAPIVRRILLRSTLFILPASALWALLPAAATQNLHLSASGYGILLGLLGIGALLGVALMPIARKKLGGNRIIALSALLFGIGTAAVVTLPIAAVYALLIVSGIAWIGTLTNLNAAMQLTVPAWVRARGMSVYLLVFMGMQAVGSFVWGLVSDFAGVQLTLLIAAGLLILVAISAIPLPLPAATGTLDRTVVALCQASPTLVFEPDPRDAVLVRRTYTIAPADEQAFLDAMTYVRDGRRRTGATSWNLLKSEDDATSFVEEFYVRSWSEFTEQSLHRWTGEDDRHLRDAVNLSSAPVRQTHLIDVSPRAKARY